MTRQITSCLTCRRRKVRCDRRTPICAVCQRGNHVCSYQSIAQTRTYTDGTSNLDNAPWGQNYNASLHRQSPDTNHVTSGSTPSTTASCSATIPTNTSAAIDRALRGVIISPGRNTAQPTSNSHQPSSEPTLPLPYSARPPGNASFIYSFMNQHSEDDNDLALYYPQSLSDCHLLFDNFVSNVQAATCLFHEPTLRQAFDAHLAQQELYAPTAVPPAQQHTYTGYFAPLVFSVFFSAIYSMDAIQVNSMFGANKTDILKRFEAALVLALEKGSFLSSPTVPVLQAFVLYLVSSICMLITFRESLQRADI